MLRDARPLLAVGALVRYLDTPAGAYREVAGALLLLRRGRLWTHVLHMGVDSPASLAAGRANWALPKVACRFEQEDERTLALGSGWRVAVWARARGPALPLAAPAPALLQVAARGLLRAGLHARAGTRPAWVRVEAHGEAAGQVPAGARPGLALSSGALWIGPGRVIGDHRPVSSAPPGG